MSSHNSTWQNSYPSIVPDFLSSWALDILNGKRPYDSDNAYLILVAPRLVRECFFCRTPVLPSSRLRRHGHERWRGQLG